MTCILTSNLIAKIKTGRGNPLTILNSDTNYILTNIKKYVLNTNNIVFLPSDPNANALNYIKSKAITKCFGKAGLKFKNRIVLDNHNKANAKDIIGEADLIVITGGRIDTQNKFFKSLNLKELLENYKGLIIGTSSGAMNLCACVLNFPENNLKEPEMLEGLGFYCDIVIPHFNGKEAREYYGREITSKFIMPQSHITPILGIPEDSYILIDNNNISFYGVCYKIADGNVSQLNTDGLREDLCIV